MSVFEKKKAIVNRFCSQFNKSKSNSQVNITDEFVKKNERIIGTFVCKYP